MSRINRLITSLEGSTETDVILDSTEEAMVSSKLKDDEIEIYENEEDINTDITETTSLRDELVSIEALRDVLQVGIQRNQYSNQVAALVAVTLEKYKDADLPLPALESHTQIDEYYSVSLESLTEIKNKLKRVIEKFEGKISRALTSGENDRSFYNNMKKLAVTHAARLDSIEEESVSVSLNGLTTYLGVAGKFTPPISRMVKGDLDSNKYFLGSFVKAYLSYVKLLVEKSTEGKDLDEIFEAMSEKNPIRHIDNKYLDGDVLMGHRLEVDDDDFYFVKMKVNNSIETIELKKTEIKTILDAIKEYADINRQVVSVLHDIDKLVELYSKSLKRMELEVSRKMDEEGNTEEYIEVVERNNVAGDCIFHLIRFIHTLKSKNRRVSANLYHLVDRALKVKKP